MKCVALPIEPLCDMYARSESDPPATPSSNVKLMWPAGGAYRSSGFWHSYVKEQMAGSDLEREP
jgi:hypothetical protein